MKREVRLKNTEMKFRNIEMKYRLLQTVIKDLAREPCISEREDMSDAKLSIDRDDSRLRVSSQTSLRAAKRKRRSQSKTSCKRDTIAVANDCALERSNAFDGINTSDAFTTAPNERTMPYVKKFVRFCKRANDDSNLRIDRRSNGVSIEDNVRTMCERFIGERETTRNIGARYYG